MPPGHRRRGEGRCPAREAETDLFLACQERLGVDVRDCFVIGDAVWDLLAARRASMLSVGVLSGGYGAEELVRAGAFRVYRDARGLNESLDEFGDFAVATDSAATLGHGVHQDKHGSGCYAGLFEETGGSRGFFCDCHPLSRFNTEMR